MPRMIIIDEPEPKLIGVSEAMQAVRRQVENAARSSRPVLIAGEHGSGKTLLAGAIHSASDRRDQPMVVVETPELPAGDSFAVASGGTVLIERIDLLDDAGSRLLNEISGRAEDVRIIATSLRMADRTMPNFGDPIEAPPLRQRMEDVPDLCRHFLQLAGHCGGPRRIEPAALPLLQSYHWPGNVTELRHLLDRAMLVDAGSPIIRAAVIQPWLALQRLLPARELVGRRLAEIEKQVILSTLEQFKGHRLKTAGALGIGVRTLSMKLKRWKQEERAGEFGIATEG